MSSDPKPPVSVEQINAYLELSAARTKKRLALAPGNARPIAATPPAADPKLPGKVHLELPMGGSKTTPVENSESSTGESAWQPFSNDRDES